MTIIMLFDVTKHDRKNDASKQMALRQCTYLVSTIPKQQRNPFGFRAQFENSLLLWIPRSAIRRCAIGSVILSRRFMLKYGHTPPDPVGARSPGSAAVNSCSTSLFEIRIKVYRRGM
jgi:hypothetical protein